MYATRVAARTVAVELLPPFHHIAFAAVFGDELVHLIAALAGAFGAFDAQRVEFAVDITEDEVGSLVRAYSITSSAWPSSVIGNVRPSVFAVLILMVQLVRAEGATRKLARPARSMTR